MTNKKRTKRLEEGFEAEEQSFKQAGETLKQIENGDFDNLDAFGLDDEIDNMSFEDYARNYD